MDSHAKMAAYALGIVTKDGLMIAAKQAHQYLELTEWLRGIATGKLSVTIAPKDDATPTP